MYLSSLFLHICMSTGIKHNIQFTSKSISYHLSLIKIGRSTSFHLTVLITLERYLVIAYPLRSRTWFSPTRSKIQVIFILICVLILCIPKYSSMYISKNIYSDKEGGLDVPSLAKSEYIFVCNKGNEFWSGILGESFGYYLYLAVFLVSNLSLLVFNIWSFKKVLINFNYESIYLC